MGPPKERQPSRRKASRTSVAEPSGCGGVSISEWIWRSLLRLAVDARCCPVGNCHAEGWLAGLGGVLRVSLAGLRGIVVSPEPDHLFGKLGGAFAGAVGAGAEAEAE